MRVIPLPCSRFVSDKRVSVKARERQAERERERERGRRLQKSMDPRLKEINPASTYVPVCTERQV